MNWTELTNKVKEKNIYLRPAKRGWYNNQYPARISLDAKRNSRQRLFNSIYCVTDPKYNLGITRTRTEGDSFRIYCTDADQVANTLDWIYQHVDDKCYYFDGIDCPFNENHAETMESEFPTIVRKTLFENNYRYKVIVNVPYTPDSGRLHAMLTDWKTWQSDGRGKMGRGSQRRLNAGVSASWFTWSGQLSFCTNDQELSLIMKLTYPEFYSSTQKVVLLTETVNG